jgi:hypothetical protein
MTTVIVIANSYLSDLSAEAGRKLIAKAEAIPAIGIAAPHKKPGLPPSPFAQGFGDKSLIPLDQLPPSPWGVADGYALTNWLWRDKSDFALLATADRRNDRKDCCLTL